MQWNCPSTWWNGIPNSRFGVLLAEIWVARQPKFEDFVNFLWLLPEVLKCLIPPNTLHLYSVRTHTQTHQLSSHTQPIAITTSLSLLAYLQNKFDGFKQFAQDFSSDSFRYEQLAESDFVFMRWKVMVLCVCVCVYARVHWHIYCMCFCLGV